MISDERLKALKAAHGETTAQWRSDGGRSRDRLFSAAGQIATFGGPYGGAHDEHNRDFAVMIHNSLPDLLDELTLLRAMVAGLQDDSAAAEAVVRLTRENATMRAALKDIEAMRHHAFRVSADAYNMAKVASAALNNVSPVATAAG